MRRCIGGDGASLRWCRPGCWSGRSAGRTSPLLPLAVWRLPAIWRSDALAACHGATLVSLITFAPIYLHVVRGVSAAQTGYVLLPVAHRHRHRLAGDGPPCQRDRPHRDLPLDRADPGRRCCSCSLVATLDRITLPQFGAVLGVLALFMGSVMGVVQVTVQNAAPQGMLGSAAGSVQFSRAVGAAFGTALVSVVLFATLGHLAPEALAGFGALMASGADAFSGLGGARRRSRLP